MLTLLLFLGVVFAAMGAGAASAIARHTRPTLPPASRICLCGHGVNFHKDGQRCSHDAVGWHFYQCKCQQFTPDHSVRGLR